MDAKRLATRRSPLLFRHESFDELEQRSRSRGKASSFPFLALPLELRQHIYRYLLPRTMEHCKPNPLAQHARDFSAVRKRFSRGMVLPQSEPAAYSRAAHIVWQKGNIRLLSVCRQLHDECSTMLYGDNTFLLFITYLSVSFRFNWLLLSGMTPQRKYDFLELLPARYMRLVKRVVLNLDYVDSYTGMIKYNVSGKGLTHGLRKQVQRLVDGLIPHQLPAPEMMQSDDRQLAKVSIRVVDGNAVLDQVKSDVIRQRQGSVQVNEDLEETLEPLSDLRGVREVEICGAVSDGFAHNLRATMMGTTTVDMTAKMARSLHDLGLHPSLDPRSERHCNAHEL